MTGVQIPSNLKRLKESNISTHAAPITLRVEMKISFHTKKELLRCK